MLSYELTLSDDATATVLPGYGEYGGTYLLPVKYIASDDDAVTITLVDADGVDYLNAKGGITDGTTGGFVSPDDRWPINGPLYYTCMGLGSGTLKLTFYVSKDR